MGYRKKRYVYALLEIYFEFDYIVFRLSRKRPVKVVALTYHKAQKNLRVAEKQCRYGFALQKTAPLRMNEGPMMTRTQLSLLGKVENQKCVASRKKLVATRNEGFWAIASVVVLVEWKRTTHIASWSYTKTQTAARVIFTLENIFEFSNCPFFETDFWKI